MKTMHKYTQYEDYIDHQKTKTLDPRRRKKWLGEEWNLKLDGFKQVFSSIKDILHPGCKALCIGARTGQEIVALREMGVDAVGIDIVPHDDLVMEGDMHNLNFEDSSFDFVFSNVFDHSLYPDKKISEIERVLKDDGHCLIQFQLGVQSDQFSENEIESIDHDVMTLFNQCAIIHSKQITKNFAGMNYEILMKKDKTMSLFYKKVGKLSNLVIPEQYKKIWDEVNLAVQVRKGKNHNLKKQQLEQCLEELHKRAFYLVSLADFIGAKNIAEVGTAQGWQFYSFVEYAKTKLGHVWSCDIKDVRDKNYVEKHNSNNTFVLGTSEKLSQVISEQEQKIDMFYIDGSHQAKAVLTDILNLRKLQSDNCVWVFDDCDVRFGCCREIQMLKKINNRFKIYRVGNTASGNPSHQVIIFGKL